MATLKWHLDELDAAGEVLTLRIVDMSTGVADTLTSEQATLAEVGTEGLRQATIPNGLSGWKRVYADDAGGEVAAYDEVYLGAAVVVVGAAMAAIAAADLPSKDDLDAAIAEVPTGGVVTAFQSGALAQLLAQNITITQALGHGGVLRVTRGMAYNDATGRSIEINDEKGEWPALTGATVTMQVFNAAETYNFTGEVTNPTGDVKQVKIELSATHTAQFSVGDWTWGLRAVLSSGDPVDLVRPVATFKVIAFR